MTRFILGDTVQFFVGQRCPILTGLMMGLVQTPIASNLTWRCGTALPHTSKPLVIRI
jgi:hypothetical protein